MKRMNNRSGFTLLEIIIVIIIIGVLASLALPRMFAMTENAKSVEALNAFKTIRGGMDMCYMMNNNLYDGPTSDCNTWAVIGVNDPGLEPGAHFTYTVPTVAAQTFSVRATSTSNVANQITYTFNRAANPAVVIRGAGAFATINVTSNT